MRFKAANLYQKVTNFATGKPLTHNIDGDPAELDVRRAMIFGLATVLDEDAKNYNKGENLLKDMELVKRINKAEPHGTVQLKAEEVARIKEKVGRVWSLYFPTMGAQVLSFVADLLEEEDTATEAAAHPKEKISANGAEAHT